MFFKYSINRTNIGSIHIQNVRERTRQALFKDIETRGSVPFDCGKYKANLKFLPKPLK